MSRPSDKSPEVSEALEAMFKRETSIRNSTCTGCTEPDFENMTDLEKKEYVISGLCATCQREIWGNPHDSVS